ncbi:glycosyltransferase [Marinococcus luteus]|uniref:glycosyltransferase n=1 Tax=Marinococcus luteus TaxID=1122204 RepID=UPI002ACCF220|nr:glycosyltransferase [Marinococcus luteus]MDZ5784220.1 glycosyltransferase [Marinococcus luteus]
MKRKLLYVAFLREDSDAVGFIKKVYAQCKAMNNLGRHTYLLLSRKDRVVCYDTLNGQEMMQETFYSPKAVFVETPAWKRKTASYFRMKEYLQAAELLSDTLGVQEVYIRRIKPVTPQLSVWLRKCRRRDRKTYYEIPDYPVEIPAKKNWTSYSAYVLDQMTFRLGVYPFVQKIVAVSIAPVTDPKVIGIKNGIDLTATPVVQKKQRNRSSAFVLAGVANLAPWHAYDRVIRGLKGCPEYVNPEFHIIGDGPVKEELKQLAADQGVEDRVIFHGTLTGSELNQMMENVDVGVGILGNHRRNFFGDSSLKNREYCARGLPFMISSEDSDFPVHLSFVFRTPADDAEVDIERLFAEYRQYRSRNTPAYIRSYAEQHLSWEQKLKHVFPGEPKEEGDMHEGSA